MLETNKIIQGDCIEVMKTLPDNSISAIICDPPYGLGFMGKEWDTFDNTQFGIAGKEGENDLKVKKNFKMLPRIGAGKELQDFTLQWATEAFRILKAGGYLLSFGGTRTYHRMACAIEDAGFEIRDMIEWVYGSGFPKSLNIGKAIDKMQGNEREVIGIDNNAERFKEYKEQDGCARKTFNDEITKGTSEWEGLGTALKPAHEPIVMARKPLSEKTVAENVLKYGTGGINIDESRVGTEERTYALTMTSGNFETTNGGKNIKSGESTVQGRFPANLIHDGSEEVLKEFPQSNNQGHWSKTKTTGFGEFGGGSSEYLGVGEKDKLGGSVARFFKTCEFTEEDYPPFFYTAKASKSERNEGCEELEEHKIVTFATANETSGKASSISEGRNTVYKNNHPTVKPLKLMEYLIKMVTPKGGIVLDPFTGSGSTAVAAINTGRNFIGIEMDKGYCDIANKRIQEAREKLASKLPL